MEVLMCFVIIMLSLSSNYYQTTTAELSLDFYEVSCPQAEWIVWDEVLRSFLVNLGIAPGLLRLHFHDCFVRGCDGSVLLDSTPTNMAEKEGPPNLSARGFEVIDRAKARVEAACAGVVSCADILAFAARDSVFLTGGPRWNVQAGRLDGRISLAQDTSDIPVPSDNLFQIAAAFAKKGLSWEEMIALLGAHSIGRSHCTAFSKRLYNFSSPIGQDPSLDPMLAALLKLQCPINLQGTVDPNLVVQMNTSPLLFENSYYRDVLAHRVLFTSDQTLVATPVSLQRVNDYAFSDWKWKEDFVLSMIKMSQIQVLTAGTSGEVRTNCRVVNPLSP